MSLYNEERPFDFANVIGQDNVVKILSNDLVKGTIKGAYLFSGVRGTGKTSIARIFAAALNCNHPKADGSPCGECASCREIRNGTSVDVFELDAASNNSVENVRDILDKVQFKPFRKKKVFVFDECHMLSTAANNALLKTLEEPPADVVFIMCTTELHKVPATIVSRCSCYEFEKISIEKISDHLVEICEKRHASIEQDALRLIAKAANGSMRDALSILDKFITLDSVTADSVAESLGMTSDDTVFSILFGIAEKNALQATEALKSVSNKGGSLSFLIEKIFEVLLDLVDLQSTGDISSIIGTNDYKESLTDLSYKLSTDMAFQIMDEFRKVYQLRTDMEISFLAAIIGVIYEKSAFVAMQQTIQELTSEIASLKQALKDPVCTQDSCSSLIDDSSKDDTSMFHSSQISDLEATADVNNSDASNVADASNASDIATPSDISLDTDFDSGFCYEEDDIPSFDAEDHSVATSQPQTSGSSNISESTVCKPELASAPQDDLSGGLPFDELVKMAESSDMSDMDIDMPETTGNVGAQPPLEASAEEASFFGDLFSDAFARQC